MKIVKTQGCLADSLIIDYKEEINLTDEQRKEYITYICKWLDINKKHIYRIFKDFFYSFEEENVFLGIYFNDISFFSEKELLNKLKEFLKENYKEFNYILQILSEYGKYERSKYRCEECGDFIESYELDLNESIDIL